MLNGGIVISDRMSVVSGIGDVMRPGAVLVVARYEARLPTASDRCRARVRGVHPNLGGATGDRPPSLRDPG